MGQPGYSDNPPPLTAEEARAKEILAHHRGRANALRIASLAVRIARIKRISVEEVLWTIAPSGEEQ